MRKWLPQVSVFLYVLGPVPGQAQARVDLVHPETAGVEVQRLGSDRPEMAAAGMELVPGDLLSSSVEGVSVTLRCRGGEGDNTYDLASPFRVLIDVPSDAPCHINLLSGTTEVTAEAPSQTSVGGVTLGSTGTEYGVEVRRTSDSLVFRCTIYTDSLSVLAGPRVTARAGSSLVWNRGGGFDLSAVSSEQLAESAGLRARFDLAAAQSNGTLRGDSSVVFGHLQRLHYQVLASPSDVERSVELAKVLLDIQLPDQARYNLQRVNVSTESMLRRYDIDPEVIRPEPRASFRPPTPGLYRPTVTTQTTTTERAIQLLESGRAEEAIVILKGRVEAGSANSLDYYGLAMAYGRLGSPSPARTNAGRALVLHAGDGLLSSAQLRALGELIARMG